MWMGSPVCAQQDLFSMKTNVHAAVNMQSFFYCAITNDVVLRNHRIGYTFYISICKLNDQFFVYFFSVDPNPTAEPTSNGK